MLEIAGLFELVGLSGKSRDEVLATLSRKRSIEIELLLEQLNWDELKTVCESVGLSPAGREKALLIGRLLGSENDGFSLVALAPKAVKKKTKKKTGKVGAKGVSRAKGKAAQNKGKGYCQYGHDEKRANNPEVGLVTPDSDHDESKTTYVYDPHIDPALQFDSSRAQVEQVIDDALAAGNEAKLRTALEKIKSMQQPYLNWAGKAERTSFEVDTVSLHVHERIDPRTIIETAAKGRDQRPDAQMDIFASPFDNMPLRDAIDFYKHDKNWSNRLIAGDSLLVMNSLLQKEGMAGQVQMIYIDPPYGIKYGSNFQPFVNKRDVKDRKDEDLTQEPEMIKAFRDTWELGIHSYLTYLRDRLLLTRELLTESGSVFVQISDENVHLIRNLMSQIFGESNCVALIPFRKKAMTLGAKYLENMYDYLIWYSRDSSKLKYNQLFLPDDGTATRWDRVELSNNTHRATNKEEKQNPSLLPKNSNPFNPFPIQAPSFDANSVYPVEWLDNEYWPPKGSCWITPEKKKLLSLLQN